jgi:molybdate transport system permease protein
MTKEAPASHNHSDGPFFVSMTALAAVYVLLLVAMIVALAAYTTPGDLLKALADRDIQYALILSLSACSITTILCLWTAVPMAYLMSRHTFRGKALVDAIIDIPIVLPPLVVGLGLLVLFQSPPIAAASAWLNDVLGWSPRVTYAVPAIVLAQYTVVCAFAIRSLRATFAEISPRTEAVALTLGCTRGQAFWMVVLPEARRGILVAGTLAWARALGEFGPVLVFAGAVRGRTEVLPTTIFLEFYVGNIEGAVAVALFMVALALCILLIVRRLGGEAGVQS